MPSRFAELPNELLESIALSLDLHDICNLRLCSRLLASKAAQDYFRSFFKTKSVSLTERSLELMVDATKATQLGCCIEELAIVGIANNVRGLESLLRKKTRTVTERNGPMFVSMEKSCSEAELAKALDDLYALRQRQRDHDEHLESGRYVELLAQIFNNVKMNGRTGMLRKLTLEVAVFRQDAQNRVLPMSGGGWRYIWRSTAETYRIAMTALSKSQLSIGGLQIFNGANMRRCSIARDEINHAGFDELRIPLASVQSLSVSLSDRVIFETDHDEQRTGDPGDEIDWGAEPEQREARELRAEAGEEDNFIGLAKLIASCPQIEDLEVHSYSLGLRALPLADYHHERLLQRMATQTHGLLHHLTKLRLRNLYMREQDVVTFVQASPIRDLAMENVFLIDGTYHALFDYCTSEEVGMTRLFFDDLWEQRHLYFDEPGGMPKFPSTGSVTGTNTLQREGDDVRRAIEYHFSDGRPLGSAMQYNWRERRRVEYGPP